MNVGSVPSRENTPQIDVHLQIHKTGSALAHIPAIGDVAPLAAFLRACGEASHADALERGEHPDLELTHLHGRKVKVQIANGIVVAFGAPLDR